MEVIVRFILHIFFSTIFYGTAKLILPIVTFGRVKSKDIDKIGFFDWPMIEKKQGTIYLGFDLSIVVGIFVWVCLVLFILSFVN